MFSTATTWSDQVLYNQNIEFKNYRIKNIQRRGIYIYIYIYKDKRKN